MSRTIILDTLPVHKLGAFALNDPPTYLQLTPLHARGSVRHAQEKVCDLIQDRLNAGSHLFAYVTPAHIGALRLVTHEGWPFENDIVEQYMPQLHDFIIMISTNAYDLTSEALARFELQKYHLFYFSVTHAELV